MEQLVLDGRPHSRYDILPQILLSAALVAVFLATPSRTAWLRWGLALILGGMVASGVDAVTRRSLTDFLGIGSVAVTNFADLSLVAGIILCLNLPLLLVFAPEKLPGEVFRK